MEITTRMEMVTERLPTELVAPMVMDCWAVEVVAFPEITPVFASSTRPEGRDPCVTEKVRRSPLNEGVSDTVSPTAMLYSSDGYES